MTWNKDADFTARTQKLFAAIFGYHFSRQPVIGKRKTPFGNYASMRYVCAARSPLALLLKDGLITDEITAMEVLLRDSRRQAIDDTDLESVILNVRGQSKTLFLLVSSGSFERDDYDRLFRVFARHLTIILPIGKEEIIQLENFVKQGNLNACLVVLFQIAQKITTDPWDEKLLERYGGHFATAREWQEKATKARLDHLADLRGPQLRTLVKKLVFLLSIRAIGQQHRASRQGGQGLPQGRVPLARK